MRTLRKHPVRCHVRIVVPSLVCVFGRAPCDDVVPLVQGVIAPPVASDGVLPQVEVSDDVIGTLGGCVQTRQHYQTLRRGVQSLSVTHTHTSSLLEHVHAVAKVVGAVRCGAVRLLGFVPFVWVVRVLHLKINLLL